MTFTITDAAAGCWTYNSICNC